MSNEIIKTEVMNFHGQELSTFMNEKLEMVAMRPIIEDMGLDWSRQYRKLNEQKTKFCCCLMATEDSNGSRREMLCMPVKKLNLWLATINPNKIMNLKVKKKVELYQEECAVALYDFWHKGIAVRTVHNPLEDLTKDALIDKLVEERVEKRIIAHDFELTRPRAKYGEISKTTGLQKTELVHSYQRSPPKKPKSFPTSFIQRWH